MNIKIRSTQKLNDWQSAMLSKVENGLIQKLENVESDLACFGIHKFSIEFDTGDHLYVQEIQTVKFKEQE